jgi:hypothetical protein
LSFGSDGANGSLPSNNAGRSTCVALNKSATSAATGLCGDGWTEYVSSFCPFLLTVLSYSVGLIYAYRVLVMLRVPTDRRHAVF